MAMDSNSMMHVPEQTLQPAMGPDVVQWVRQDISHWLSTGSAREGNPPRNDLFLKLAGCLPVRHIAGRKSLLELSTGQNVVCSSLEAHFVGDRSSTVEKSFLWWHPLQERRADLYRMIRMLMHNGYIFSVCLHADDAHGWPVDLSDMFRHSWLGKGVIPPKIGAALLGRQYTLHFNRGVTINSTAIAGKALAYELVQNRRTNYHLESDGGSLSLVNKQTFVPLASKPLQLATIYDLEQWDAALDTIWGEVWLSDSIRFSTPDGRCYRSGVEFEPAVRIAQAASSVVG